MPAVSAVAVSKAAPTIVKPPSAGGSSGVEGPNAEWALTAVEAGKEAGEVAGEVAGEEVPAAGM